jgi:D-xylulose kinase
MSDLVLAIDVGTTGVRSIVFDTNGKRITSSYEEFKSYFPQPSWVEQDANSWWNSVENTIHQCLKHPDVIPSDVLSLSITNQRETIVPVDDNGNPLRNAIVWQDRRTISECEWIRETIGVDTIYSTTGLTIDPYFSASKILWIKHNETKIFDKAHKFLLVHDFIIQKLTGQFVTDYSNASRTMLFDINNQRWSKIIPEKMGIPLEKLPEVMQSGSSVGEISSNVSHKLGLDSGTLVITGGGDQQCAALGIGVTKSGSIKSTTGTGTFILAYSNEVRLDSEKRLLCSCHVIPESYVVEASIFTTGSALRWFRDNLGYKERVQAEELGVDPYEVLTEGASEVSPGADGIIHIPHFVGAGAPYWNPHARGIFAGLALGHSRRHLIRAILEGVAYEIRTNLDVLKQLSISSSEVRVTGGAARSKLWMQIQSDVLNLPIILTEIEEATALGAAILACKGAGVFPSVSKAAEEMVTPVEKLEPSQDNREVYDGGYERYKSLYSSISKMKWN